MEAARIQQSFWFSEIRILLLFPRIVRLESRNEASFLAHFPFNLSFLISNFEMQDSCDFEIPDFLIPVFRYLPINSATRRLRCPHQFPTTNSGMEWSVPAIPETFLNLQIIRLSCVPLARAVEDLKRRTDGDLGVDGADQAFDIYQ